MQQDAVVVCERLLADGAAVEDEAAGAEGRDDELGGLALAVLVAVRVPDEQPAALDDGLHPARDRAREGEDERGAERRLQPPPGGGGVVARAVRLARVVADVRLVHPEGLEVPLRKVARVARAARLCDGAEHDPRLGKVARLLRVVGRVEAGRNDVDAARVLDRLLRAEAELAAEVAPRGRRAHLSEEGEGLVILGSERAGPLSTLVGKQC